MTVPRPAPTPGFRPAAAVLCAAVAGGYGAATSWIPAPSDPHVFWVANLFAPWLALACWAGWTQRGRAAAVGAGVLAELACVAGFYARQFGTTSDVGSLIHYIVLGPQPWGLIAVPAGVVYGALGHALRGPGGRGAGSGPAAAAAPAARAGAPALVAGWALGAAFLVEPWLWPLYEGYRRGPFVLWVAETTVGLAVAGWATVHGLRPRRDGGSAPAAHCGSSGR
ncbi:hypothetical protein ACEZCY_13820 [Streptacidiphilus sp. N1-12]|uniref:Uncharacterized protein n=2 Tax=Streptacidiphilus alkalitolerans TaxID=3342712 RepID=A0ABV6WYZ8_9ACTN